MDPKASNVIAAIGQTDWVTAHTKDDYCKKLRNLNVQLKEKKGLAETESKLLQEKGKTFVPDIFKRQVIERFHDHPLSCHTGIRRVVHRIQQSYTWPNLLADVTN